MALGQIKFSQISTEIHGASQPVFTIHSITSAKCVGDGAISGNEEDISHILLEAGE